MLVLVLTGASNASGGLGAESACLHMVQLNWSSVSEGEKKGVTLKWRVALNIQQKLIDRCSFKST
jgi:hypothetical protein